jgi:hypothetical protein
MKYISKPLVVRISGSKHGCKILLFSAKNFCLARVLLIYIIGMDHNVGKSFEFKRHEFNQPEP